MGKIDDDMNTRFTNDKHRLAANIVFTAGWIKGSFNEVIRPYGLSSPQFNILRILRGAKDWVNMNEVKERMVEKSPNTTRLCDKLLDKGLIERRRSETDRRVVYLHISKKGLELLEEIDQNDDGSHKAFLDNVSEEEARIVNEILNKLRG